MRTIKLLIPFLLVFTFGESGCKKEIKNNPFLEDEIATQSNSNKSKALSHTKQYSAEVATGWFTLLANITRTTPYLPPITVRLMAYAGITLYESIVPGMPSYQSIYTYLTRNNISTDSKRDYYWPACANAALARITTRLLQNYSASPNLIPIQELENSFNNSFQSVITPEQLQFSNEFGRYVADIIYEWSKTDGTLNPNGTLAVCPPYTPLGGLGNWVPVPPGFFPAAGACQGALRTFIPNIVTITLPPPPPAYSTDPSSGFYKMNLEIQQIGLTVTAADVNVSQSWRDLLGTNYNAPAHMIKLTSEIIDKENLNLEDASVIYAKHCMAVFDAVASVFHAKFHYALLRPVTYIRSVMGVNTWNSLYPAPGHPAYPASAPAATAAAAYILEQAFGSNYSFSDSTQKLLYGTFTYQSFNALLEDIGRSRTHSGINFKQSVDAAISQGKNVGQLIYQLPFKKI